MEISSSGSSLFSFVGLKARFMSFSGYMFQSSADLNSFTFCFASASFCDGVINEERRE